MARLLSFLLVALVMSTCQQKLWCVAQNDQQGLGYKIEENTGREKREPAAPSSIFKLSNLLPSFMKRESSRPKENRNRPRKHSHFGTTTSSSTNNTEHKEPLSSAFRKSPMDGTFASTLDTSTPMNQRRDYAENAKVTHVYPLSNAKFPEILRQTGTEVHRVPERYVSSSIYARTARESDGAPKERRNLYRMSSRFFQGSKMKLPVRERPVVSGQSSSSKSKQSAQESGNSSVLMKIEKFAERSYSLPTSGEFVRIGDAEVPRKRVAAVGDVDGNKVTDYIVSNVAAKNYSGTVRLYLMGEGDSFLYTRDLIPGNWGFEHPELKAEDRFGTTVFRLPSTGSSSQCFVAITAPGDRSTKDESGSVYILELSEKGNVKNHKKLSATKFLELVEEQQKEQETRGKAPNNPSQRDGRETSELQHLDGVSSMLFINATGGVQAVLNVQASEHNDLLKNIERHLADEKGGKKEILNAGMDRVSSRVARDDSCLLSETECTCKLEAADEANSECFDVFRSTEKDDRVICLKKSCSPVYICTCDGKERCRRVEGMEEVYVPDRRGDRGELYCTSEKRLVSKATPSSQT